VTGRIHPLPPDIAGAFSAIRPSLPDGAALHWVSEVDSTNDVALKLAQAGAAEGTAVMADFQRAGRGRRGREWFSPAGAGLYLSVIVRGGLDGALSLLTLAAGVAVARAVRTKTGLAVELKWPNDLVMGRPWRKLGGILCESTGIGARLDAVVVGVGVNLAQAAYPAAVRAVATSLEVELGRSIDRASLAMEILVRLIEAIRDLRGGDAQSLLRDWRKLASAGLEGAVVHWTDREGERSGRARDIDETGALLVDSQGRVERIVAGEVTWNLRT
jgi:BirA family transcriptional regulator, biotin operon repressor / biotin---[acetyl-CoA-carboxylase] ligase